MGLDVTGYERLTKIDGVKYIDGEVYNRELETVDCGYDLIALHNAEFPGRADDLDDRGVYSAADSFGFRAGSYGGYNAWRNELAKLAGYPEGAYREYGKDWPTYCAACWNGAQGPFAELINFSDCEGVIGAAVSKKLAGDFAAFDDKARAIGGHFYTLYGQWRKAFDMASNDGAVSLH